MGEDERGAHGECKLGMGFAPLRDTGTCPRHKPIGTSFAGQSPESLRKIDDLIALLEGEPVNPDSQD